MSSNLCNGNLSERNKISDAIQAQMKAEATTDQTRLHFSCDLIKLIQWGKKTRFSIMFIGRRAIVLFVSNQWPTKDLFQCRFERQKTFSQMVNWFLSQFSSRFSVLIHFVGNVHTTNSFCVCFPMKS